MPQWLLRHSGGDLLPNGNSFGSARNATLDVFALGFDRAAGRELGLRTATFAPTSKISRLRTAASSFHREPTSDVACQQGRDVSMRSIMWAALCAAIKRFISEGRCTTANALTLHHHLTFRIIAHCVEG